MTSPSTTGDAPAEPVVARGLVEHLRSFGPGIVAVLTWLGAGDIVTAAVAGANYGYTLAWALVLALGIRWFFVSTMAKYQLCNPHGRSVLDGLAAVHRLYPPFICIAAVVTGHMLNAYMLIGLGQMARSVVGAAVVWPGAAVCVAVTLALSLRPAYARIELVFKIFLGLLCVSLVGTALWVGPDPAAIVGSVVTLSIPASTGAFDAMLVAVGMIGAVGGSLANLTYAYFLEAKGWRGPEHRRVQTYDFLLAVGVIVLLNLSVWTLGAELVHASGRRITNLEDLTGLLVRVLGVEGRWLFELGLFSAVFTSLLGVTVGFGHLVSHAFLRWRRGGSASVEDRRGHPAYRVAVVWLVASPLVWTMVGDVDFVALTLSTSALVVPLIPALAGGLWWITASERHIGREHANSWWENVIMGIVFVLAVGGSVEAVRSIAAGL